MIVESVGHKPWTHRDKPGDVEIIDQPVRAGILDKSAKVSDLQ